LVERFGTEHTFSTIRPILQYTPPLQLSMDSHNDRCPSTPTQKHPHPQVMEYLEETGFTNVWNKPIMVNRMFKDAVFATRPIHASALTDDPD
jgi:hypothetical protein